MITSLGLLKLCKLTIDFHPQKIALRALTNYVEYCSHLCMKEIRSKVISYEKGLSHSSKRNYKLVPPIPHSIIYAYNPEYHSVIL